MDAITTAHIGVGDIVIYKLLPRDRPVDAQRVWRGKVLGRMGDMLRVELLDPGYTGLTEPIWTEQIVSFEQHMGSQS